MVQVNVLKFLKLLILMTESIFYYMIERLNCGSFVLKYCSLPYLQILITIIKLQILLTSKSHLLPNA